MRRLFIGILTVMALVTLANCQDAASSEQNPAVTGTVTSPAAGATRARQEQGFRVEVKGESVPEETNTGTGVNDDAMRQRFGDSWDKQSDSIIVGRSQKIPRDQAVGDLVTIAGNSELDGYAKGDVVTVLGSIRVGKEAVVRGDVATIFGNTVIEDGAIVHGDGVNVGGTISDPGNGIKGKTVAISGPFGLIVPLAVGHWLAILVWLKVLRVIGSLLLAYLVIALMPNAIEKMGAQVARNPFISGCVGAGAVLATPLIFLLLIITIVGIFLVPLALVVGLFLGIVAVYYKVGQKVRAGLRGVSYRPFLDVTIGVLLINLICFLPIAGPIIKFVLGIAGLGALILTRFGAREGIGTVPHVTPPAVSAEKPV